MYAGKNKPDDDDDDDDDDDHDGTNESSILIDTRISLSCPLCIIFFEFRIHRMFLDNLPFCYPL